MITHLVELHAPKGFEFLAPSAPVASEMFIAGPVISRLDSLSDVALKLAKVQNVEAVFTSEYSKQLFVWVVIPERDYGVYQELFAVEKALIDDHPGVAFDFTIMPSGGKSPVGLVTDPQARMVYVRR